MPPPTILVIEDDAAIREGILDALHFRGYRTLHTGSGREGASLAGTATYDLLLLDLVLPHRNGLDILAELRESRPTIPVIILTARGAADDRVRGLRGGADDYVVKPFSVDELLARIEAVLRRSPERPADVATINLSGGCADLNRCEVRFDDGSRTELSERERELLRYLACNAGRAVSRDEILSRVWRLDPRGVATRTIDVHGGNLRRKLRDDETSPKILLTVRGKGYMFQAPGARP